MVSEAQLEVDMKRTIKVMQQFLSSQLPVDMSSRVPFEGYLNTSALVSEWNENKRKMKLWQVLVIRCQL